MKKKVVGSIVKAEVDIEGNLWVTDEAGVRRFVGEIKRGKDGE